MIRAAAQEAIILLTKPYISRELPGWGFLYRNLVGAYERDWVWQGARPRLVRDKMHGYTHLLNISKWADRSAFFLNRWYDLPAQLLVRQVIKAGDTILDVGANRGMFALCASHAAGPSGRVICFEPNPAVAQQIALSVQRNGIANIDIRGYGLSDADETLSLSIPQINSGEASFAVDDYAGSAHVAAQVKIGDEVVAGLHPILIKIDVEGFEERALRGLRRSIAQAKPLIITEIIEAKLLAAGSSRAGIESLLKDLGYEGRRIALKKSGGRYELSFDSNFSGSSFDMLWFPKEGGALERVSHLLG